jgi:uroporphyrin-III C-methyltransferase / precorrin-2 dehydrogenase / sirohydrochlorin ferrochelatase
VTQPPASPDYPLLLDLVGRRVLVVGGGPVAARRAGGCVDAGALVHVVAPQVCEDLRDLAAAGKLVVSLREYAAGDEAGAWLVHACTGDAGVDGAVAAAAEARGTWCVRASAAERSPAWVPAVARAAGTTVAVSAGGDPRRARAVRDAVALLLETGGLPLRRGRPGPGHVSLVGGGPGDPGLITTRGRQLLAAADVVLVDRLAPRDLLSLLPLDVEVVDVGKGPGNHPMPQEEINRLLVEHARAGRHVVRLKGGDPFLLGRGGEEVLACREAGVPVSVVPGVTSAVAVPAAAGIPVTHRGVSRQVTIASGHGDDLDWAALAHLEGTLVLLMGLTGLPVAVLALLAYGRSPDTPVALVEAGTTPAQRVTVGDLTSIVALAAKRQVKPPAVIVIGDVVGLREALGPC